MSIIIEFEPVGRRLDTAVGRTVLEAAKEIFDLRSGGVNSPCGGKGLCGRCKVRLADGELAPPNENEKRLLGKEDLDKGYRLACQAVTIGPAKIEIPPETLAGRQSLQLEGTAAPVAIEPAVKRYSIPLKATSLSHPYPIWQQAEIFLSENYGLPELRLSTGLINRVGALAGDDPVTVTMRGTEIINVFPSAHLSKPLGLAVDLGTTKIAGYLVDLESGAVEASEGVLNPQIAYGEDLISRLAFALEDECRYNRIAEVLREGLDLLLQSLCRKAGVSPGDVEEGVIAGNTAMHHLLLKLPVAQLGRAPYVPAATLPLEVKSRDLGLGMAAEAYVYFLPAVAGFVGGDHVAMILSSGIHESCGITLGLDIGTNTEIVLARSGEMISCSCASGPAFEGAHIQQGMRAVDGAICKVSLAERGSKVFYETIGGKPPIGICGSGVLDAVAGLYREKVVSHSGRLDSGHPMVRFNGERKVPEFVLAASAESGAQADIVITQKDVSEIQLAKAAIAAGTKVLLEEAGLKIEDIDTIIVAGAFGTHLNLESAIKIGMLPDLPLDRYQQVGNASGGGARMALLSLPARKRAEEIARKIKYIELAAMPRFSSSFLSLMRFP